VSKWCGFNRICSDCGKGSLSADAPTEVLTEAGQVKNNRTPEKAASPVCADPKSLLFLSNVDRRSKTGVKQRIVTYTVAKKNSVSISRRELRIEVLLRAGAYRPRENLASSITSLALALPLTTPCSLLLLFARWSTRKL
jgi:hypothetical protein